MPLNLIFTQPGNFTINDNGIPGDNTSVIRDGNGVVIFSFAHPVDALGFTVNTPGVNLTFNFFDSMGAADFSIGDVTNAAISPESIVASRVATTGNVTLVTPGKITEGGADAAADIVAGTLVLSAGTGIGTGANPIETQTGLFEAETTTGGINIKNIGSVQIGGLSDEVNGLSVLTSGNINFTAIGSIFLSDLDLDPVVNPPDPPFETVHGGNTSGNVTLIANGFLSDIITNTDTDAITVPRGNLNLTAGRDIAFGTIGVDFDNDVRANNTVTINAGRDFLIDGFSDLSSDDFFNNTGGNLIINAGRNIHLRNVAGSDATITASGTAGADVIFTTGFGGAVILDAPSTNAVSSSSGNVTVNADRALISASSGITAGAGGVTLRPATDGRAIILGSASDAAFALELSDSELDRIFTPSLVLGGADAGAVTAIAPFSPLNAVDVTIQSGSDITFNGVGVTVGGDLTLRAGDDIRLFAGSSVTAGGVFTGFVDFANTDPGVGGTAIADASVTSAVRFFGNADADTLSGGAGNDSLAGLGGSDVLNGRAGNDSFDGGGSGDTMSGGLGNDTYLVNHAGDTVVEAVGAGVDEVRSFVHYTLLANFENLTLLGAANINGIGNAVANAITGNAGKNSLVGGGDNDSLLGGGGNDSLLGGDGNDLLNGGSGNDTYVIDASDVLTDGGGIDTVRAGFTYTLLAGFENLTLTGAAAINGTGNTLANTITGNNAANVLNGGGGNDSLVGGGGNDQMNGGSGDDTLTGGPGADNYRFMSALNAATNVDQITDFSGSDLIHLDDAIFSNIGAVLDAFEFRIGAAAADANDRIIYNSATGAMFYDADGTGGSAQIRFATLDPGLALSNVDFLMV